jgi:hypothetical protein
MRYLRERDTETGQKSLTPEPLGEEPDFGPFMTAMHSALEKLPEVDGLIAEIAAQPELAHVVFVDAAGNSLAEDARKWWVGQFLLVPFVSHLLAIRNDASWNDEAFDEVFDDLVLHLARAPIPIEWVAPLDHFESTLENVEIDETTRIAALDDELAAELVERFGDGGFGFQHVTMADLLNWSHVIRCEGVQRHPVLGQPAPTRAVIPDLVTALRLLRESGVRTPFVYTRALRRTFIFGGWGGLSHDLAKSWFPFASDLVLEPDDVPVVVSLHRRLLEIEHGNDEAKRRFELALGRINSAAQRVSVEDRLLDYWIALETLFVPDSRGEISFRARTRVARFVSEEIAERQQIAETLSRSYDRRSKVVHGDKPKADTSELTNETGEVLRRALRVMLEKSEAIDLAELDLG